MQRDNHQTLPPPKQPAPQSSPSQSQGDARQVATSNAAQQSEQIGADITMNPETAHDSDLIEKDWVNKTKDVVEQNKRDPHRLNQEIAKLRADYMKKRYNTSVKVSED